MSRTRKASWEFSLSCPCRAALMDCIGILVAKFNSTLKVLLCELRLILFRSFSSLGLPGFPPLVFKFPADLRQFKWKSIITNIKKNTKTIKGIIVKMFWILVRRHIIQNNSEDIVHQRKSTNSKQTMFTIICKIFSTQLSIIGLLQFVNNLSPNTLCLHRSIIFILKNNLLNTQTIKYIWI